MSLGPVLEYYFDPQFPHMGAPELPLHLLRGLQRQTADPKTQVCPSTSNQTSMGDDSLIAHLLSTIPLGGFCQNSHWGESF